MSTIVAVKKDNQIIIGADTLTKYGESKETAEFKENYSKIVEVEDNLIAFVGHASFGLILDSYFSSLEELPRMKSRIEIFQMARALHPVLKKDYFLVANDEDSFEGSDVDCLVANQSGIFGVYSMQNVHQFSKFYAFGSGGHYAMGAMNALYHENKDAREIALAGLESAITFDDASAGPIEIKAVAGS